MKIQTMHIKIVLFLMFTAGMLHAQPGFKSKYDFGTGASFHDVVLKEDTLIIAGTVYDIELEQWSALFLKMDTLGNILDYRMHFDTVYGGNYVFSYNYRLTQTVDGGYSTGCNLFNAPLSYTSLLKMDVNGDLEFRADYYDSNASTVYPIQIINVTGGYWIVGRKQLVINGLGDIYIQKIDFSGELIWEKLYGSIDENNSFGEIVKVSENEFVIGGSRGYSQLPYSYFNTWTRSWLFAVDSLGNILWEWESEDHIESVPRQLAQTQDGGWVYNTHRLEIVDQYNVAFELKSVKRTQNFNLLWERVASPSVHDLNSNGALLQSPSGEWVSVFRSVLPDTPVPNDGVDRWTAGCFYKMTAEGDSLWMRCDTMEVDDTNSYRYNGAVMLPSGSMVAVGNFKEPNPGGGERVVGWVVKVDENGCLEELCNVTSTEDLQVEQKGLVVYPNPVRDYVVFEQTKEVAERIYLSIFDARGREVASQVLAPHQQQWIWENDELTLPGSTFTRHVQRTEFSCIAVA
jgi:hypothetical protein